MLTEPSLGRRLREVECAGTLAARVAYAPGATMAEHSHERASLTLVVAGLFEERIDGRLRRSGTLTVIYKPPRLPHATRVGPLEAQAINLSLPTYRGDPAGPQRLLIVHGGPLVAPMLRLGQALEGPPEAAGSGVERCLDALRRWSDTVSPPRPDDPLVDRARHLMALGLPVAEAARRAGADPTTVWRRFRRCLGVSPIAWRRRERVATAARLLAAPGIAIGAIAADSGFADQSHLTRAFRRETGLTPGQFRKLTRRGSAA